MTFCELSLWAPPVQAVSQQVETHPCVPEDDSSLGVWDGGSEGPRAHQSPTCVPMAGENKV